jgi:dolichyl-phosphate-mannose-protein mannosyltransferase
MPAKVTRTQKIAALFMIVVLGLALRIGRLDRVSFNEDEVHKVEAARAYLRANFSLNLEHPMLMKSLIAISLAATDTWNGRLGHSHQVSEEVAVRLPNVIFGSLTAVVIFLLAQEFFGFEVGLLSALLWSIGTIAIMVNREAKEDTLLVFFTWLAYYFYLRAKKVATTDTRRAEWYYGASGGSFGLMLASKYFPHYLGLIFLFFALLGDKGKFPPRRWRDSMLLFGTCALVFILADPVVLLPSTWTYMLHYAGEGTMTHHGYLVMGRLYFNDPAHLGGGMPIYLYPLFLILKSPVSVLVALIVGLVETWKRRVEPGPFFLIFMFLFWIVPFSLLSAKWLRYMLSWMPTVYIIAALGVFKIFTWASAQVRQTNRRWVPALAAAIALVFLVEPASMSAQNAPYYSLYLNPLGLGRTAYYFPHDEMNDMGLREAIRQICLQAPEGASVGGETAPVFAYYFHRFGRDDLRYFDLSDQAKRMEAPPTAYIVVQDGRKYYENISFIQKVEGYRVPILTVEIAGAPAVRVYRDEQFAELRIAR